MKIKWGDTKYTLYIDEDTKQKYYQDDKCRYFFLSIKCLNDLNDTVEILEEQKKETKPLTKKDIEALGYACGEIQKCFTNGWTKSLENKPLEEQKKIPEKLKEFGLIKYNLDYIDYKNIEILKECLNNDFQIIYDTLDLIIKNQNKLIDYLKSKGE